PAGTPTPAPILDFGFWILDQGRVQNPKLALREANGSNIQNLAATPEYRRAMSLARLGLWSAAALAFDDLAGQLGDVGDGPSLAALLGALRPEPWPWLTYAVALEVQRAARAAGLPASIEDLPRAAQESLYPVAWGPLVGREAEARNVDPWLLLGLI